MTRTKDLRSKLGSAISASVGKRESVGSGSIDSRRDGVKRAMGLHTIDIHRIIPDPDQARKHFSEQSLQELGESIKNNGQAQAIVVRYDNEQDIYIIIAGERRYRAAKLCGIESLRAEIKEGISLEEAVDIQTVENLSREDLNPIDQANAYKRYMDVKGLTQQQCADALGCNQSSIGRALKLLKLPADLQEMVALGTLAASVARDLPKLGDDEAMRAAVAKIQEDGMNRDEAQGVVSIKATPDKASAAKTKKTHKLKQFTAKNGVQLVASGKKKHPQTDVVEALEELLDLMRKDKRIKQAA